MKQVFLALALSISHTATYAVTITSADGDPLFITDLTVQGTTYDGWFGWTTPQVITDPDQFPFIGNQAAAEDAALQIAQALDNDGYTNVERSWLTYFFVPFEDPHLGSVQAYRGRYFTSNGGEWLVSLETTHGPTPANSWVLLKPVPLPASIMLFSTGLLGLVGIASRKSPSKTSL